MDKEKIKKYLKAVWQFIVQTFTFYFLTIGWLFVWWFLYISIDKIFDASNSASPMIIAGVIVGSLAITSYTLILKSYRKKGTKHFVAGIVGFILSFALLFLAIAMPTNYKTPRKAYDTKRVGDLRQAQIALEIYKDEHGAYPPPVEAGVCGSVEGEQGVFELIGLRGVQDPIGGKKYTYSANDSLEPTQYVLLAELEDKGHYYLEEDLDGNILGCDCDDPNYCVGVLE